jgi:hypothetical protein
VSGIDKPVPSARNTSRPRQFDYSRIVEWYAQDTWRVAKRLTGEIGGQPEGFEQRDRSLGNRGRRQ